MLLFPYIRIAKFMLYLEICTTFIFRPCFAQVCDGSFLDVMPAQAVEDALSQANDYLITRHKNSNGQLAIIIKGDVVRLNKEFFPFFERSVTNPLSNIEKLTIDAREIIIEMPIRFSNSKKCASMSVW